MPALEAIGRVVQMSAVPALGVGLSLLAFSSVEALVPVIPAARAVLAALLSFAAVVVVSPWLGIRVGLWRRLPITIAAAGVQWRVAHLPAPSPFLTHVAALPWLRTVLVTDGLFGARRIPTGVPSSNTKSVGRAKLAQSAPHAGRSRSRYPSSSSSPRTPLAPTLHKSASQQRCLPSCSPPSPPGLRTGCRRRR